MNINLCGKLALVSGSTAGIGYAIATGLARAGAAVVVNGRTRARVDAAVASLLKDNPASEVSGIVADAATARGCAEIVSSVPACDILVNNVGAVIMKPFEQTSDADWMQMLDINLLSGVRLSRSYAEGMKAKGWGRMVFVCTESSIQIGQDLIAYGASKLAQLAVSRGVAQYMAGSGVTVNAVLPSVTMSEGAQRVFTEFARGSGKTPQDFADDYVKSAMPSSLLQRAATVEEVANMVVYLCSREASATSGAALRVDGGAIRGVL